MVEPIFDSIGSSLSSSGFLSAGVYYGWGSGVSYLFSSLFSSTFDSGWLLYGVF